MNKKPFGINVGTAGLALALAGVGCSGAVGDGSQVQGAAPMEATPPAASADIVTPAAPADIVQRSSNSTIVHATVSLGEDHIVQFVEYQPGLLGLIEIGRSMIDVPMVTPEVKRLAWSDQYRHFAGASASLPKEMEGALARAALTPPGAISEPPTAPPPAPPTENTGNGPHFYTAGEQTWFNQTFCNGAEICMQGFDFTNMQTPRKIGRYTTFAMIGSEGPSNGTFETAYWKCAGVWPFPTICKWISLGSTVIVPGHFITSTLNQDGSWFFLWQLRGGGANTLVSSSADF